MVQLINFKIYYRDQKQSILELESHTNEKVCDSKFKVYNFNNFQGIDGQDIELKVFEAKQS